MLLHLLQGLAPRIMSIGLSLAMALEKAGITKDVDILKVRFNSQ
jgi:hypothetical protein